MEVSERIAASRQGRPANRATHRTGLTLQQGAAAARGVVVADGGDSCEHRRVRVGEEDVQWVRREVSEVLTRELLERAWLGLGVGLG